MSARPSQGGLLVAKVHQVGGRVFARLLREEGSFPINPAQGRILFALWKAGRMGMTSLARETALEPSTLTSMLDRLEDAGLLRRLPSEDDRRVIMVERTNADRALEERYKKVSDRMTQLFYGSLGEAERKAFEAALARILDNLLEAERGLRDTPTA
jgi:DNA-binding MarR family transcriptional regulator